jgi:hypothetical protein
LARIGKGGGASGESADAIMGGTVRHVFRVRYQPYLVNTRIEW